MGAWHEANDASRIAERRCPDRAVRRWRDCVKARVDAMILCGIDRLVGFRVLAALAVPVAVENERGPALRSLLVARLVEQLGVEPPDYGTTAAGPERAVRVLGEHEMVRAEAGVDVRQLLRFGIVHREL